MDLRILNAVTNELESKVNILQITLEKLIYDTNTHLSPENHVSEIDDVLTKLNNALNKKDMWLNIVKQIQTELEKNNENKNPEEGNNK